MGKTLTMLRLLPFMLKNLFRSKTRLISTVGGCAVAAFIVCFFMTVDHSLSTMLSLAEGSNNLIVTQKDHY